VACLERSLRNSGAQYLLYWLILLVDVTAVVADITTVVMDVVPVVMNVAAISMQISMILMQLPAIMSDIGPFFCGACPVAGPFIVP
jgi:hypothetical protein